MYFATTILPVFAVLASLTTASPALHRSVASCWETCSTSCVQANNLRGGLCDSTGTCTCLTGIKRSASASPEPYTLSPEAQCWTTCGTSCLESGNLRGGLCSSDGTCTCLEGLEKKHAAPAPNPDAVTCWETCSTDCEAAGNLRGGLCSADGFVLPSFLRSLFQQIFLYFTNIEYQNAEHAPVSRATKRRNHHKLQSKSAMR